MIPTTSPLDRVGGAIVLTARLGRYLFVLIWSLCRPKAVLAAKQATREFHLPGPPFTRILDDRGSLLGPDSGEPHRGDRGKARTAAGGRPTMLPRRTAPLLAAVVAVLAVLGATQKAHAQ